MARELDVQVIFQALKRLISTTEATCSSAAALEPFTERLKSNLFSYRSLLNGPEFKKLLDLRGTATCEPISIGDDPCLALYSEFCSEAIILLAKLDDLLNILHEEDENAGVLQASSWPPSPPKTLFSLSDQRTLFSVLEFVVGLGLYPYLMPGVDNFLKLRMKLAESVHKAPNASRICRDSNLYKVCTVLVRCFNNPVIGPGFLARHLSDVLAALIQVPYAPQGLKNDVANHSQIAKGCPPGDISEGKQAFHPESIRDRSLMLLGEVLERTYQPLVVKTLLILQGISSGASQARGASMGQTSPKWLQKACGRLLSERLMGKNGVHNVITGIMESTGQSPSGDARWRKCKAVARVLANPLSLQCSVEDYYSIVCPQLLVEVLQTSSRSEERLTIAMEALSLMMNKNREVADTYLFHPLVHPLACLCGGQHEVMARTASEVEVCIGNLHKVCTAAEPSSEILTSLFPYSPLFFGLWRSAPQRLHASQQSEGILERVLSAASNDEVVQFLCAVSFISRATSHKFKILDQSLFFSYTGDPPKLTMKQSTEAPRMDTIEASAHYVIKLFQTSLRSRKLIGQFFEECMTQLAIIISKDAKLEFDYLSDHSKSLDSCSPSSSALLACEHALPKSGVEYLSDAGTLYITAALCENCSDVVLRESNIPSVLGVCKTIIECHATTASRRGNTGEVRLAPGQSGRVELTGGPVTLSICFGLVSAILGGAKTVDKDYRSLLTSMRPSLDYIAADYPIAELCVMAGDMSICIGTLGAVWFAEAEERASNVKTGKKILKKAKSEVKRILTHGKNEGGPGSDGNKSAPLLLVEEIDCEQASVLSPFQSALRDLRENLVPVRGHALISLTKLISSRDKETLTKSSFLLERFKENLSHSDSYVYLPAINGLVALALSSAQPFSENVVRTLCQEYGGLAGRPDPSAGCQYDRETGQQGGRPLLASSSRHSVEVRMKLGEALVKVFRELRDMLPHYLEDIVASLLTTVRDAEPLLRASSLSNIAEICSVGTLIFTPLMIEVLSCVAHILKSDMEGRVRQAALLVLKHIIKGTQAVALQDLSEQFLEIYRLLKQVESTEQDELTRAHAQAALGELDTVMRTFIFSEERKLEKKITILN